MKSKTKRKNPEVVYREGRPSDVILDIDEHRRMLERLEDKEDLDDLVKIRTSTPSFRKFDDFLAEQKNAV